MSIRIVVSDITKLTADALVNAANEHLSPGSGVCGAIFRAAGYGELLKACNDIGGCETGKAVITPGFNLNAKYIIHTVGPRWKGGSHYEAELLYSCYNESLELAKANECHSIVFPLISAGIFGYPSEDAWLIAIRTCTEYQTKHRDYSLDIRFAVLNEQIKAEGLSILMRLIRGNIYLRNIKDELFHMDFGLNFFDLLEYAEKNKMCLQVGCTTCGCGMYRDLLKYIGRVGIEDMLINTSPYDMLNDNNLKWHDALEILFVDFRKESFERCYIIDEYDYVWTRYKSLRASHVDPFSARVMINKELQERAERFIEEQERLESEEEE